MANVFYIAHRLRICAVLNWRRVCHGTGEYLKRFGRKLVAYGTPQEPRWDIGLLQQCGNHRQADVHYHSGQKSCGPLYAAYRDGSKLILKFNWFATRRQWAWDYGGDCTVEIHHVSAPYELPNGDRLFMFKGGWGVLHFDPAFTPLEFAGGAHVRRVYPYF